MIIRQGVVRAKTGTLEPCLDGAEHDLPVLSAMAVVFQNRTIGSPPTKPRARLHCPSNAVEERWIAVPHESPHHNAPTKQRHRR